VPIAADRELAPMIAADTSTWVAFFADDDGEDVGFLDRALAAGHLVLPAPVLAELLSDPKIPQDVVDDLLELPLLEPGRDFWVRAGRLRASVLARKRKARLADALIAQLCLDRGVKLITRDRDFRAFVEASGLDLVV
jgi:predicted nucleic acid-binding protein